MPSTNRLGQFGQAVKALLFPGRGGSSGGLLWGWPRFNKLTDPWPRSPGTYTLTTLGGSSAPVPTSWEDYAPAAYRIPQVAACIAAIERIFPDAPLTVEKLTGDDDWEPDPRHPLRELLNTPNPWYAENTLWQGTLCDRLLDGNAFWHIEFNRAGAPVRFDYIPRILIEPQWPESETTEEFISHYVYRLGGKEIRFEPEEVLHFRWGFDPENMRLGWSPLKSATLELALLWAGSLYGWGVLRNFGAIAAVLENLEDDTSGFTQEIANQVREQYRLLTTGANSGGLLVPTFKSRYTPVGQSPEQMALDKLLARPEDLVCSLLGLNPMFVGLTSGAEHKTYANFAEAEKSAWHKCVKPLKRDLGGDLGRHLLPLYGKAGDWRIGWDFSDVSVLQPDLTAEWARVVSAVEKKLLTVDEGRAEIGFPELTPEQRQELAPEPPPPVPESRGDAGVGRNGQNGRGEAVDASEGNPVKVLSQNGAASYAEHLRARRLERERNGG